MRTPKGLRLTYRPLRLDDEVWAELQKMKATGTINEGLRRVLFEGNGLHTAVTSVTLKASEPDGQWTGDSRVVNGRVVPLETAHLDAVAPPAGQGKASVETYQRPKLTGDERLQIARGMRPVLRQKGDKTR